MIKLGYSVGKTTPQYSLKETIEILLSVEQHAAELSYIVADRLEVQLDAEDIENLKKFNFISIHAPAITTNEDKVRIKYSGKHGNDIVEQMLRISQEIGADAILFHPDAIDDFNWLNEKIGDLLVFENMDVDKSFGKSIEDLEQVFKKAPNAKWVCDVNHIYTIDKSMKLAEQFHEKFQDRLLYYHLSGYGGWHDVLHLSREDVILEGIKDFSKPIIDEGRALRNGKDSLLKENKYILDRLQDK